MTSGMHALAVSSIVVFSGADNSGATHIIDISRLMVQFGCLFVFVEYSQRDMEEGLKKMIAFSRIFVLFLVFLLRCCAWV